MNMIYAIVALFTIELYIYSQISNYLNVKFSSDMVHLIVYWGYSYSVSCIYKQMMALQLQEGPFYPHNY